MNEDLRTSPRQRRGQRTVNDIIDAAERLIVADGQVSFTATELARSAGISVGNIYYWFPDTTSVVTAVIERCERRMVDLVGELRTVKSGNTTPEFFSIIIDLACAIAESSPGAVTLSLAGTDRGRRIMGPLVAYVEELLAEIHTALTPPELRALAESRTRMVIGLMSAYVGCPDARHVIRRELLQMLTAWQSGDHDHPGHVHSAGSVLIPSHRGAAS